MHGVSSLVATRRKYFDVLPGTVLRFELMRPRLADARPKARTLRRIAVARLQARQPRFNQLGSLVWREDLKFLGVQGYFEGNN